MLSVLVQKNQFSSVAVGGRRGMSVISRQEVQTLLDTSQTTAPILLKNLSDRKLLRKAGATRNICYELVR